MTNPSEQKPKPIRVNLPLSIFGYGDTTLALKRKLFLIKKFNLADTKRLIEIFLNKANRKQPPDATEKLWLHELWRSAELDDLDLTELFVSALPTFVDKINPKFLEKMDPMPWFHKDKYGDLYDEFMKEAGLRTAKEVARFALPRVRAKLALQEIICATTAEPKYLAKLIERTPRYLACPHTADWLCKFKIGASFYGDNTAKNGFKLLYNAIRAKPIKQARKYGYWHLEYYFFEVASCLKTLNSIKDRKARESYLKSIMIYWGIPKQYGSMLKGKVKNPKEETLSIMVDKNMIEDTSSYRNVVMPHIKRMKAKYPYIRACNPIVEKLLDMPSRAPNVFGKFEVYKQLESFDFDLSDQEVKRGHAI